MQIQFLRQPIKFSKSASSTTKAKKFRSKYFKGQERQQAQQTGKKATELVMQVIEDYNVKLEDSNSKK